MINTEIYSDLTQFHQHLEEVEEYCQDHGTRKVMLFDKGPYCYECSKEKVQLEGQLMANRLTDRHYNNDADWLPHKSIFLDKTLKYANFESYIADDKETSRNKEKALEIARSYYKGDTFNTILQGRAGAGKSHLAMSILKNVNKFSKPPRKCLFVSVDEVLRRIKGSFSDPKSIYTESFVISLLSEPSVLVLDDLGSETGSMHSDKVATDYTTQILYAVFNSRQDKSTIITTNLDSNALSDKYDPKLMSRMLKASEGHVITFKSTTDKRIKHNKSKQ